MLCTVKFTKQLENGTFKRVSEKYLIAAMTFTDAEKRIYEELGTIIRGEFMITGIAPMELHDIFHYEDSDVWYNVKIAFDSDTEEGDKKKKVSQNFLVSAHSAKDAYDRTKESMKGMLVDFSIPSIKVSPIVEIFPYREELDKEISRRPLKEGEEKEFMEAPNGKRVFTSSGSDFSDDDFSELKCEMEDDDQSDYEDAKSVI